MKLGKILFAVLITTLVIFSTAVSPTKAEPPPTSEDNITALEESIGGIETNVGNIENEVQSLQSALDQAIRLGGQNDVVTNQRRERLMAKQAELVSAKAELESKKAELTAAKAQVKTEEEQGKAQKLCDDYANRISDINDFHEDGDFRPEYCTDSNDTTCNTIERNRKKANKEYASVQNIKAAIEICEQYGKSLGIAQVELLNLGTSGGVICSTYTQGELEEDEKNDEENNTFLCNDLKALKEILNTRAIALQSTLSEITNLERERNEQYQFKVSEVFTVKDHAKKQIYTDGDDKKTPKTLIDLTSQIADWMTLLIGSLAVTTLIIGGFMMIISGGDETRLETGKTMFTYSLIGLVITLLAFGIIRLIQNLLYNI